MMWWEPTVRHDTPCRQRTCFQDRVLNMRETRVHAIWATTEEETRPIWTCASLCSQHKEHT